MLKQQATTPTRSPSHPSLYLVAVGGPEKRLGVQDLVHFGPDAVRDKRPLFDQGAVDGTDQTRPDAVHDSRNLPRGPGIAREMCGDVDAHGDDAAIATIRKEDATRPRLQEGRQHIPRDTGDGPVQAQLRATTIAKTAHLV